MRSRPFLISFTAALVVLAASLALAPMARAQTSDQPPAPAGPDSTAVPPLPGAVSIGSGLEFTGATITPPDGSPVRTFDAYHAAVFVQSWLGSALFGNPPVGYPAPGTPVYRVDVTGSWGGEQAGYVAVYYGTNGTKSLISFPSGQTPTAQPNPDAPGPKTWFEGTKQVTDAFNGTATLVGTAGVLDKPTPPPAATTSAPSSSTSKWLIAAELAVPVAVALGGIYLVRLRRRRQADLEPEPELEHDVEARV